MVNVSNEFKTIIKDSNRKFYGGAEITLSDSTVLTLDNSKIRNLKIEDATSQSGTFTVGSAIVNKLTLTIDNLTEEFSNYDFTGAIIRPTVGLQLSETIETLQKGVFISDDPKSIGSIITLTALDNMSKFDRDFKDVVIAFPTTPTLLLNAIGLHCGVVIATSTFLNDNLIIPERPLDDAMNCREVISWIAQLSGNFARCNTFGALELKWYDFEVFEQTNLDGGIFDETLLPSYQSGDTADGGNFTDYATGDSFDGGSFVDLSRFHHFYSLNQLNISTDDVVVTGITVFDTAETPASVTFGTSGYLVVLEGNKLIQTPAHAQLIANTVGVKIVGMRFRPCSISVLSDPSIESGDVAYVSDRKGNAYQILVTNSIYAIGKSQLIKCDAESPLRNSSKRYTADSQTIIEARKYTEKKLTAYDLAVQRMTSLVVHAFGLYQSKEVLEDGSTIFYSHDKPTRAESSFVYKETSEGFFILKDGEFVSGWDAEGNAVFNVLSAIGINADWINVITNFTVGTKFSVSSDGKLTTDEMVATNGEFTGKVTASAGKIAKMNIDNQGLFMDPSEVDKYFRIENMESIIHFYEGMIYIAAPDSFQAAGTDYNFSISNGALTLSFNDGTNVFLIQGSSGEAFNISISDVGTGNYNNSKLLLNGVPVVERINTMTSQISTLQSEMVTAKANIQTLFDLV